MRHLPYLLALFLLACGTDSGRFRLEGHFKNLNQGEFYIYDAEQGSKDTIGVRDGRFVYDIALHDTTTLILLFPNYSELPIFAISGDRVKVDGDVSHLKEVDVSGNKENELMTAFRLRTNEMTPPEVKKEAVRFITDNASSVVSLYLLRRYLLLAPEQPDYDEALQLCRLMMAAQPTNIQLVRLEQQLMSIGANASKRLNSELGTNASERLKLPPFEATDEQGHSVTIQQLTAKANVIYVWAAWDYTTQSTIRQLNKLKKEKGDSLAIVTISLDANPADHASVLKNDSITWPNVCDSLLWQSPLLAQLSIATMPASIIIDQDGYIVARNLDFNKMKEKIEELLKQ